MIVPPSDPAIPFAYSCVYWIYITYQKGILDHWGERCSILDLLFLERGGVAKFKLSYNNVKIISLQNVMEKIINDIITLFLFNILKLLRS